MKEKEFNLSEHNIEFLENDKSIINNIYSESDVKEFIRLLKKYAYEKRMYGMIIHIDNIAGERLIEEKTK